MTLLLGGMPEVALFKTNRGRWLSFGAGAQRTPQGPEQTPAQGHSFAGICGVWSYASKGIREMTSCAMLSGPMDEVIDASPDDAEQLTDEQGRHWDGSAPPLGWKSSGEIYGNNKDSIEADTGGNHIMTTGPDIVTWLDLSKPIDRLEIWYTHPQRTHAPFGQRRQQTTPFPQIADVQFISIELHSTNGTSSAVGPQDFDDLYRHPENHEPLCDCNVYYEGSRTPTGKKLPFKLHYYGEEWQVGGRKMASLRIWASVFLEGLQFVSEDGAESPCFGHCEGEPSGTIEFGDGQAVSCCTY